MFLIRYLHIRLIKGRRGESRRVTWLAYVPTRYESSPHFMVAGNVGAVLLCGVVVRLPPRMSRSLSPPLGVFSQVVSRRLVILLVRRLAIHSGRVLTN